MLYGNKRREQTKPSPDGKAFLTQAREEFAALFESYVDMEDEFESLAEFGEALETAAWTFVEELTKRSFKNGLTRGRGRQKSDR